MTEEEVRRLEADVAEPLADMIRRAELAAETPAGHAEFNVTMEYAGRVLHRVNRARFVVVDGVLNMVRGMKVELDTDMPPNSLETTIREAVSDVVLGRNILQHSRVWKGDTFTLTELTIGIP